MRTHRYLPRRPPSEIPGALESGLGFSAGQHSSPRVWLSPTQQCRTLKGPLQSSYYPESKTHWNTFRPQHHFTKLSYAFGDKSLPSQRSVQKYALHLQPSLYHLPTCLCSPIYRCLPQNDHQFPESWGRLVFISTHTASAVQTAPEWWP